MIFIGIDPGITGAVAIIDGGHIVFHDTPTIQTKKGRPYIVSFWNDLLYGFY